MLWFVWECDGEGCYNALRKPPNYTPSGWKEINIRTTVGYLPRLYCNLCVTQGNYPQG